MSSHINKKLRAVELWPKTLSSLLLSHLFQESGRCLTPGERSETDSAQSPETLRERNTLSPALLCKALANVVSEPRTQRNSTDSSVWVESVLSFTTQHCHITIPIFSRSAQCYIKWRKSSAVECHWHFFTVSSFTMLNSYLEYCSSHQWWHSGAVLGKVTTFKTNAL